MKKGKIFILIIVGFLCGCMATVPIVDESHLEKHRFQVSNISVAVADFVGAPSSAEAGATIRDIVIELLVESYGTNLVSPSKVAKYCAENTFTPNKYDLEGLKHVMN